jgi:hypothetical protein
MIDLRNRYQLAQFRITNHGGSAAHNVRITWQQQLRDAEGKEVLLGQSTAIPVIPERESASVSLGSSNAFVLKHPDTTCRGSVNFENASGRKYSKPFVVSAEHERVALVHNEELPKTLWEIQKIPGQLERVAREIAGLANMLERYYPAAPSNNESTLTSAEGKTDAASS